MDLKVHFRKRLGAGFFGGEGFILQKSQNKGCIPRIRWYIEEYNLAPGQRIVVDTGNVAFFDISIL